MDCWIKIFVLLAFIPQIAAAGLFDMLNEKYIENMSEMPISVYMTPDKNWQPSYDYFERNCKRDFSPKFMVGWVDIIGFKNLVKVNDVMYYNPPNSGEALIGYETISCVIGHRLFKGKTIYDLTVKQQDDQVVANLKATQILYWIPAGGNRIYDNLIQTFSDSEIAPQLYSNSITPSIEIIEYNNSIEPKIVIIVTESNASKIMIQYGNNVAIHTQKAYRVEVTEKGVYYANATPLDSWDVHGFARFGNSVIINTNLSAFDYSQLNITVSDIFGYVHAEQEQFNITRVTYDPEKIVYNPLLFWFIGTLLTLFGASVYLIGRIQL